MRVLALGLATLLGAIPVVAQNTSTSSSKCFNYGVQTASGSCQCPPGFGGTQSKNCDMPVCGGSLYMPTGVGAGDFGNISQCSCDNGWDGPTCSVCKTHEGCVSSLTKYLGTTSTMALPGMNSTLVCSNEPRVYAASHMTCEVVQAMLQGLFPGRSQLTISRFLNGSSTPGGIGGLDSANLVDGVGEVWAQLWLNGTEQFYCHATNCNQTVETSGGTNSSVWDCPNLSCTCRPGTAFCGGGESPVQDLTSAINPLKGPLKISCTPDGKCFFDQEFLRLFGTQGLPLSGCQFGECVNQYVIDQAEGLSSGKQGNGLSGGVIAGLAVVGAILLAIILVVIWGVIVRNKARKAPHDDSLLKKDGVGLVWRNVGYEVGHRRNSMYKTFIMWLRGSGAPARGESPHSENGTAITASGSRLVLNDVSGSLPPGAFCCVLGPSGAGKSTLVDILAGRRKAGVVSGKVSYLTKTPNRAVKIGYCDQSDVLNPTSTVLETLMFAAKLRLPENVAKEVKEERARKVLNQLGLTHIANTRVGSGEHRGISGGEMRRVSIGIELVANPDVLILDEPTSGLDSVSAARIVSLLKSLTTDPENRTTIVASIHQPSSALYQSFSQVIVLSKGRQVYFGPGGNTPAEFFAKQGRPCPPGYNVADHLLEVATDSDGLKFGDSAMLPTSSHESLSLHPASSDDEKSHSLERNGTNVVPTMAKEVDLAEFGVTEQKRPWWPKDNSTTTFLTQFEVLAGREWKMLKRDKTLFFAHFVVFAVVAVFAGGLYFKVSQTISGFQNRIGALFFLGSLIAFGSLSALTLISEMRPLFLRERSGGFYSPQAWLLARAVFDIIPLRIIPTIVLSIIVYFMVGLSLDAARFFKYELILIEYALAMVLYNFILGACIEHMSVAILLSSLWNLFNMTFAGFFVNINSVPKALSWLARLAPLNYCLEAISVNEIPGLSIDDQLSGVPISVTASVIMEILFGFNLSNYYRNVLVLFAFIAGFGLILIFAVIYFLRERR